MEETSRVLAAIWEYRDDRRCESTYFRRACLDIFCIIARMILGDYEVLGALPTGLWLHEPRLGGVHLLGIDRTLGDDMIDAAQNASGTYTLSKKFVRRLSVYGGEILHHPCPGEIAYLCSGYKMFIVQTVRDKFRMTRCASNKIRADDLTIPYDLRDRNPVLRVVANTYYEYRGTLLSDTLTPLYVIQCDRDVHLWVYSAPGCPDSEVRRVRLAVDEGVSWNGDKVVIWNSAGRVRDL